MISKARFDPPGLLGAGSQTMPMPEDQDCFCQKQDGYRGIWHAQPPICERYGPKYGGGLGTYPYQARPMAVYAPEVNRTFFCWGGTTVDNHLRDRYWDYGPGNLLQMVSFYDHETGTVPKPICVFDKWCADPHDNPVLQIDRDGYLWLFSPSHGEWTTPSFIHRSRKPYDISEWETVRSSPLFAYPQVWYDQEDGWLFFHTLYDQGRGLFLSTSADGVGWSKEQCLARAGQGHYAVSHYHEGSRTLGIAFDYHPPEGGLEARTNLYYIQTRDAGKSWQTADGQHVDVPLLEPDNRALIRNYESEGKLVYLRDLKLDGKGLPIITYVTSDGNMPGPEQGTREWYTAKYSSREWEWLAGPVSDHNYDMGELYIRSEEEWQLVAPTEPGPQRYATGGEMALWTSADQGVTWKRSRQLTRKSRWNHTFSRVPHRAHPDFAAFWADGHGVEPSPSRLYFTNSQGREIWRLPMKMTSDSSCPEKLAVV